MPNNKVTVSAIPGTGQSTYGTWYINAAQITTGLKDMSISFDIDADTASPSPLL